MLSESYRPEGQRGGNHKIVPRQPRRRSQGQYPSRNALLRAALNDCLPSQVTAEFPSPRNVYRTLDQKSERTLPLKHSLNKKKQSAMSSFTKFTQLPQELRLKVIASVTTTKQIAHMWLQYRLVSKTFKKEVEDTFRMVHMRRTCITYPLRNRQKEFMCIDLGFKSFDADRVIFSAVSKNEDRVLTDDKDKSDEWKRERLQLWRTETAQPDQSQPGHFIMVNGFAVMDSKLPGSRFDYEKCEISFRWKEMWNAFCGELDYTIRAGHISLRPNVSEATRIGRIRHMHGSPLVSPQPWERWFELGFEVQALMLSVMRVWRLRKLGGENAWRALLGEGLDQRRRVRTFNSLVSWSLTGTGL